MHATLSPEEIAQITGYAQPCKQLTALHGLGFERAYRNARGEVVLSVAHHAAVERGEYRPPGSAPGEDAPPKVNLAAFAKPSANDARSRRAA